MEFIILLVVFSIISFAWFLLKLTFIVSVADPRFAAKAFAAALASSAAGYLAEGHVVIKIVFWGVGGFVLYAIYKYASDRA